MNDLDCSLDCDLTVRTVVLVISIVGFYLDLTVLVLIIKITVNDRPSDIPRLVANFEYLYPPI
jgi:hypothetical protein